MGRMRVNQRESKTPLSSMCMRREARERAVIREQMPIGGYKKNELVAIIGSRKSGWGVGTPPVLIDKL